MSKQAYKLCLAVLKQDASGTAYPALPEKYASLKWNATSIVPTDYDFTNYNVGDTTIETVETNTITQLSKEKDYNSGAVTPPTMTFNSIAKADSANMVASLQSLTGVDDPFKVLVLAGVYETTSSGVRSYKVINAVVGVLTGDGGRNAEAKQNFTGSVSIQACHVPIVGATNCAATLSWTESTGAVQATLTSSNGDTP